VEYSIYPNLRIRLKKVHGFLSENCGVFSVFAVDIRYKAILTIMITFITFIILYML
jgi:hypothetical protein